MNYKFPQIILETESEFDNIASKLLNEFAIENHESIYRLTEIEFYWNSTKHKDDSTYPRKHTNPNHGEWYFHYSGVDIALKNEQLNGYGGILIRGIYSIKEQKPYNGPMVCAMKLFSGTSVFSESIKTKVIQSQFEKREIQKTPRVGLGNNAIKSGTQLLNYRYQIKL